MPARAVTRVRLQPSHSKRAHPAESRPQSRYPSSSSTTKRGQRCLRISHDDCPNGATPSYGNPVVFLRRRTTGEYLIAAKTEYINTSTDSVSHGSITGRTAYGNAADTDISFVASWTGGQFVVVVRFSGSSVTVLSFERYTGG